jgi:endoglycosylceramidase
MIDAAWAARTSRVIVDFHQDVYASPFCGDGFPLWTLPGEHGPAAPRLQQTGAIGYVLDPDVRGAFDRFWADENDVQGKFSGDVAT